MRLTLALALFVLEGLAILKLDFHKTIPADAHKRATIAHGLEVPLSQVDHVAYLVNITVGTPRQNITVQLDTGSSDLWVPAKYSQCCKSAGNCFFGGYDNMTSSTYVLQAYPAFNIVYGKGNASGIFMEETVTIGNAKIPHMVLGLGQNCSSEGAGVLGIGLALNEPTAFGPTGSDFMTPTLVDRLKAEGIIQRKSYSLWLNSLTENTGSILFGAIDSSKFIGTLVALPFQGEPYGPRDNVVQEFFVDLTSLKFDGVNLGSQNTRTPVLLDSGTSAMSLPGPLFNALFNALEPTTIKGSTVVPCSLRQRSEVVSFGFGGKNGTTIDVPLSELIDPSPNHQIIQNGVPFCALLFGNAGNGDCIFGDAFLRSAYVVYDLENEVAAIAQANFSPGDEEIQIIPEGTALPGVTMTATATASAIPR